MACHRTLRQIILETTSSYCSFFGIQSPTELGLDHVKRKHFTMGSLFQHLQSPLQSKALNLHQICLTPSPLQRRSP